MTAVPSAADERQGVSPHEIVIGSCCALSGPLRERGTTLVEGGRAYFSYINDKGGVNGRKIRLDSRDDAYSGEKAIDCFNELLRDDIFAGSLFFGTAPAAKYVEMADARHVPLVGMGTGANFLQEPVRQYVFNDRPLYSDEAKTQVDALWNIGVKKIAVLYQDDSYGASVLNGVHLALEAHSASVVSAGSFPRTSTDVTDAVQRVARNQPQAVIVGASGGSLTAVMKKRDLLGKTMILCMSAASEYLVRDNPKDVDGVIATETMPLFSRTDLPTCKLYHEVLQKYSPQIQPGFSNFEGFLGAMILVEGLKRAGDDLTREGLVRALNSISDLDIGLGPEFALNYTSQDHRGLHHIYFVVFHGNQPAVVDDFSTLKVFP